MNANLFWRNSLSAFAQNPHTGKEHQHLGRRSILCLVADNTGFIEGPASHKRKRNNLDNVHFHQFSHLRKFHHIFEAVEKRPKIRIYFRLYIAR